MEKKSGRIPENPNQKLIDRTIGRVANGFVATLLMGASGAALNTVFSGWTIKDAVNLIQMQAAIPDMSLSPMARTLDTAMNSSEPLSFLALEGVHYMSMIFLGATVLAVLFDAVKFTLAEGEKATKPQHA